MFRSSGTEYLVDFQTSALNLLAVKELNWSCSYPHRFISTLALFQGSRRLRKSKKNRAIQTLWVPTVAGAGAPVATFHHGGNKIRIELILYC